MSTLSSRLSELDHLTRRPYIPLKTKNKIRCALLRELTDIIAGSGHLDHTEIRIAEHCLSALYPYRDNANVDKTEQRFFKAFLDDVTRDYLRSHFGNGTSIFRSNRYPSGTTFDSFLYKWHKNAIERYFSEPYVYLSPLRHFLLLDLEQSLKELMSTKEYQATHAIQIHSDREELRKVIYITYPQLV